MPKVYKRIHIPKPLYEEIEMFMPKKEDFLPNRAFKAHMCITNL